MLYTPINWSNFVLFSVTTLICWRSAHKKYRIIYYILFSNKLKHEIFVSDEESGKHGLKIVLCGLNWNLQPIDRDKERMKKKKFCSEKWFKMASRGINFFFSRVFGQNFFKNKQLSIHLFIYLFGFGTANPTIKYTL